MASDEPDLVVDLRGRVLVLRINRPEARNALSPAVIMGIGNAMTEADSDERVSVVVLTGTGDRAFCAGMDLRGFATGQTVGAAEPPDAEALAKGTENYLRFKREGISKPVIGAANATAVAGGFELLLACDIVVASENALFGLPEVKRGLFAAGGGMQLGRRVPFGFAMQLALTGDMIDAHRAAAMGLVNAVVPPDQVFAEAFALAERIAANGPLAVVATKRLMHTAFNDGAAAGWELQSELQPVIFGSDDAKEGALAFVERRQPVWRGR
jgi:enoyl-CoA hydratase/carnithine racemase